MFAYLVLICCGERAQLSGNGSSLRSEKSRVSKHCIVCSRETEWDNKALCQVTVPRNWPEAQGLQSFTTAEGYNEIPRENV